MHMCKISPRLQISQRNKRIMAILMSICQVIISHVMLFLSVLGLMHAEEIETMLSADINEENEMNSVLMEYSAMPNGIGETVDNINQIRFESAKELASYTLLNLYLLSGIAGIYLLTCLVLLVGTVKNRPHFISPWLFTNIVIGFFLLALMIWGSPKFFDLDQGGLIPYWCVSISLFASDIFSWILIYEHYKNLVQNKKLADRYVESATVKIPFHYRKENIYLGNNGMKHHVCDPLVDQNNYVM
ncbi:uncharacterized protein DMENIID0001_131020 [Sergentomyia squamirostris]